MFRDNIYVNILVKMNSARIINLKKKKNSEICMVKYVAHCNFVAHCFYIKCF